MRGIELFYDLLFTNLWSDIEIAELHHDERDISSNDWRFFGELYLKLSFEGNGTAEVPVKSPVLRRNLYKALVICRLAASFVWYLPMTLERKVLWAGNILVNSCSVEQRKKFSPDCYEWFRINRTKFSPPSWSCSLASNSARRSPVDKAMRPANMTMSFSYSMKLLKASCAQMRKTAGFFVAVGW